MIKHNDPWRCQVTDSRNYTNSKSFACVINKKDADVLCINRVLLDGFELSNGVELFGSLILFPHSLLSWHVTNAKYVNEDSLTLFKILEPKLDILIFGYGSQTDYTPEVRKTFTQFCRNAGLRYEALPTEKAAGLFNFLSLEHRYVAAALITPSKFEPVVTNDASLLELEAEDEKQELLNSSQTDTKKLL
ncbi:hypothetical protein RUM43_012096 [Polyplax serrata]|uniref:NADH dehydrogenase [ubiquinone] 1 alpha subcomplex assembly factor 3 n=1 Tax=Polyplax serrata TaxID=468196 RepID=A0AAN8S6R1_POLSC